MKEPHKKKGKFDQLRQRAEELLLSDNDRMNLSSSEGLDEIIHELEVYQVELELQNEELRRAQEELTEAHDRYFDLYDMAPVGYLTLDENGLITRANLMVAALLGIERRFLQGQAFRLFVSPQFRDIYTRHRSMVIKSGNKQSCELRLAAKGRDPVWVQLESLPDQQGDLGPIGCRCALNDISRGKQAEVEKDKAEAQLRHSQKMEAIGTLAGGIAHEFNNILAAILGYAEIALLDVKENRKHYHELRRIVEASLRARELVRQILDFSRKRKAEFRPLNLTDLIKSQADFLTKTIPKMINLELRLLDDLKIISGDCNRLKQVLINMVSNARDAMLNGGELVIETKNVFLDEQFCQKDPEIYPGEYVLLSISDAGHGMDQKIMTKIFDPFFTTKEVGKGTGLGLSTVFGIVRGHGGHIDCISVPGKGSTFNIYFPVLMVEQALRPEDEGGTAEAPGGSETIMLVDDEDTLLDVYRKTLSKKGYKVMLAGTGEEALKIYRGKSATIDLIILDINMPGMGGHQSLAELIKINPNAKVIIASGYSLIGQSTKAIGSGAAAYLTKPFVLAELLKTVRGVLDRKSAGPS